MTTLLIELLNNRLKICDLNFSGRYFAGNYTNDDRIKALLKTMPDGPVNFDVFYHKSSHISILHFYLLILP